MPVGAFSGITTLIWFTPGCPGACPANCTSAVVDEQASEVIEVDRTRYPETLAWAGSPKCRGLALVVVHGERRSQRSYGDAITHPCPNLPKLGPWGPPNLPPVRDNTGNMAELEIHHEGNESDPTGKKVGVLAGVLAVLLAVVTISSHRTHTAALMHKSTANDEWAYYQANSIKSHIQEVGESILSLSGSGNAAADTMRARFADQRKKYDAQKDEEQAKARQSDAAAETDEKRALRYDFGEGLLEMALVLSSLYFIARKPVFPVMGVIAGAVGVALAITGLFV